MVRKYTVIGNRSLCNSKTKTDWGKKQSSIIAINEKMLGATHFIAAKAKGPDTWGEQSAKSINPEIIIIEFPPYIGRGIAYWQKMVMYKERNVLVANNTDIAYALFDCDYIKKKPWGGGTGHTLAVMANLGKPSKIFCQCGKCTLVTYPWALK